MGITCTFSFKNDLLIAYFTRDTKQFDDDIENDITNTETYRRSMLDGGACYEH